MGPGWCSRRLCNELQKKCSCRRASGLRGSLPVAKQSLLILCGARHTASRKNSLLRGLGRPLSFAHACSDVHTKEHALMCVCCACVVRRALQKNKRVVRACVGSVGRGLQGARAERSDGTQASQGHSERSPAHQEQSAVSSDVRGPGFYLTLQATFRPWALFYLHLFVHFPYWSEIDKDRYRASKLGTNETQAERTCCGLGSLPGDPASREMTKL